MTMEELRELARMAQALNPGELTEAIGHAMIQEGMATMADRQGYRSPNLLRRLSRQRESVRERHAKSA